MHAVAIGVIVATATLVLAPGAEGAFPGENGRIVFQRNFEIATMEPNGSDVVQLTNNGGGDDQYDDMPVWSADGTQIAFVSGDRFGERDIFTMDPDGSNLVNITNSPESVETGPGFSPDGATIVFSSDRDAPEADLDAMDLYTISADGTGTTTRLTDDPASDEDPVYSPGGETIIFSSERTGGGDIFTIDADDGANPTNLINDTEQVRDSSPDLSPDGTRLTWIRRLSRTEVFIQDVDGAGRAQLTGVETSMTNNNPSFSPDGTKIIFDRNIANHKDVFTINPDGTEELNITEGSGLAESEPSWGVVTDQTSTSSSTSTSTSTSSTSTSSTSTSSTTTSTSSSSTSTSTPTSSTSSTIMTAPAAGGPSSDGSLRTGGAADLGGREQTLPRTGRSLRSYLATGLLAVIVGAFLTRLSTIASPRCLDATEGQNSTSTRLWYREWPRM